MNPEDLTTAASVATGLLAVFGTVVAKWLDSRATQLKHDLRNESELRTQLLGRIERLELALTNAAERECSMVRRIAELEGLVKDKDAARRELELRHDALLEAHRELSERYQFSEQQNRKLRDEMLSWYLRSDRNTPVPPAPYPPKEKGR